MKNYADMSDFEINKATAIALGIDVSGATEENNAMYGYVTDYCNNWADAGQVILENKIGIETTALSSEWMARTCQTNMSNMTFRCSKHKNPLRAAMIVFLMMKDADK